MKVHYDKASDTLRVLFSERPIAESDEIRPGVIADFDAQGAIVGLEVLDARKQITRPDVVEIAAAA